MAFKRSRLNPFQNYRSITSFSVDWPRTIRLVYASVSILSVCAVMLRVIVIQTRWIQNDWRKSFIRKNPVVRHVTRPCPCMTTSIIIKITRVISMWTLHWITVSCHGFESPMATGYYCAIFPFSGGGKKKKGDKKTKADWATTGIPVITCVLHALLCLPINVRFFPSPPPPKGKSEHWHRRQK